MNILLTCAGRRNYLVNYFKDALAGSGKVYTTDSNINAAALQESDGAYIAPGVKESNYIEFLFDLCKRLKIRMVISLNDLELPVLAEHRKQFADAGTILAVSSQTVVNTCFDKWETHNFLKKNSLGTPKTYLSLEEAAQAISDKVLKFPLVVKPRWGSASIGIEYPEDYEELKLSYILARKRITRTILAEVGTDDPDHLIMIQEYLRGQEFGLDVVNDLNGNYVTTIPKKKLGMRAGETDKAMTIENEQLEMLGTIIGKNLKHIGNLDCDVFFSDKNYYILELNPRFGGGYPFTHVAGANLPAALIAWAEGREPDKDWLTVKHNVVAAKYDNLIVIKKL